MNKQPHIITLTTDFGMSDAYAGVMKGVILSINPNARIVDITHDIPAQDIHEAAFLIHSAHRYFPQGTIHTLVVDPGVGSHRQAIVCQTQHALFVCPDNGILTYLLQETENETAPAKNTIAIQNPDYFLTEVSNTFHGRDIFAPVAAHLSLGVPLTNIGPSIQNPVQIPIQKPQRSINTLTGQIVKIDTFGNAITNISDSMLADFSHAAPYQINIRNTTIRHLKTTYANAKIGEPLAIIGSNGLLEIAVNGGSAKKTLGITQGDTLKIQKHT